MLLGGSVSFYVTFSLPVVQRLLGQAASSVLTSVFGSEVAIGSVDASMPWRPVLDDVTLLDLRGDTLLTASRMATRINLWQALQERYRLSHVQLYKPDIRLVQDTAGVLNCQHIIDALSSDSSGGNGTDLQIVSILVRRGHVSYLAESKDGEPGTDICLDDLSFTVYGLTLMNKRLSAHLQDMHVNTPYGALSNLRGEVNVGADGGLLTDVLLNLPYSHVAIDEARWSEGFAEWNVSGGKATLDVRDVPPCVSLSSPWIDVLDRVGALDIDFAANGTNETADITHFAVTGEHVDMDAAVDVRFTPLMVDIGHFDVLLHDEGLLPAPLSLSVSGLYDDGNARARASVSGRTLTVDIEGTLRNNDAWHAHLHTVHAKPVPLLSLVSSLQPTAKLFGDSASVSIDAHAGGRFKSDAWKVEGKVMCESHPLAATISGAVEHGIVTGTHLEAGIDVQHIVPSLLGANGKLAEKSYALSTTARLSWPSHRKPVDANGHIELAHLTVLDDTLAPHPLIHQALVDISPSVDADARTVSIYNDMLDLHATLKGKVGPDMNVSLNARLNDATALNYLADTDIRIFDPVKVSLHNDSVARLYVEVDSIHYGNEILTDVMAEARRTGSTRYDADVSLNRYMKDCVVKVKADASMADSDAKGLLTWYVTDFQANDDPDNNGMVQVQATLGDTTSIGVNYSAIALNGTLWEVSPSSIYLLPDGAMRVDSFVVAAGDRHLRLHGRMSSNPRDTLYADLRDVNLGYIFDLIKFDDVDFDGDATGTVRATGLTSSPKVEGRLQVRDFSFNHDVLGNLDLLAGWNTDQAQLNLDGRITGDGVPSHTSFGNSVPVDTRIVGRVNPGKSNPRSGLDLDVQAQGFSLGFLREYTDGIFEELNGAVSGRVRIYGPFNAIDLHGDLLIDHCTARVPTLNVAYQLAGDSVHVRPGRFIFDGVRVSDMYASADSRGTAQQPGPHSAAISGGMTHKHFKGMAYDFGAQANNLLGYDERDFGDMSFYGTAYLTGDVHLDGGAGRLNVDVKGTTNPGSILVYNSTTPDAMTHSDFITYVSRSEHAMLSPDSHRWTDNPAVSEAAAHAPAGGESSGVQALSHLPASLPRPSVSADMRLNFNVDVTPDATLRVIMDTRSGDYIEMHGHASIVASYYNKGSFRMYGTYKVQRGRYHMTLQDFIRKDFTFSEGGTINFSGAPMQAALNLQAVYTVSGVSLNDLAATTTFSSQRTRVNCLMNLTGQVSAPQVSFDFDLPQATQDEVAMVRSLVSTEEERNLQAIYLLGLGTFYVQDQIAEGQTRGGMAVNSFLSSTLSSQINSILGDAIGSSNWSFGTNISTGQMGWSEVQAEGSLSGRLFDDRLLVNGTFGYREGSTTNQTGFVGDFDMQWLLTRNGTISLKAYSQTTDRYFTKSALTTQGVGLLLKKDFNTLRELFNRKK